MEESRKNSLKALKDKMKKHPAGTPVMPSSQEDDAEAVKTIRAGRVPRPVSSVARKSKDEEN